MAARLGKRLRQLGFKSFAEYYRHVLADSTGRCADRADRRAHHQSHQFSARAGAFRISGARGQRGICRELRRCEIWSAACSSGEEPYSIAMCLAEALSRGAESRRRSFRILATDISTRVLAHAQRGVYPAERFKELPEPWRRAYLLRGEGESQGIFQSKAGFGAAASNFERLNLIEPFHAPASVSRDFLPQCDDVFR